jgi:hypothetical protein
MPVITLFSIYYRSVSVLYGAIMSVVITIWVFCHGGKYDISVFSDVTPCSLVERYDFSDDPAAPIIRVDDEGSKVIWKVGTCLSDHIISYHTGISYHVITYIISSYIMSYIIYIYIMSCHISYHISGDKNLQNMSKKTISQTSSVYTFRYCPVILYAWSKKISKAIPVQFWTGSQGSRRLRRPHFQTIGTWMC